MKNNKLCAGLAPLLCLIVMPVCIQAGSSGGAPVQSGTAQEFLLANRAMVICGVVAAGLAAYGLYRLDRPWFGDASRTEVARLHDAVQRDDIDAIQALLCAGADVNAVDRRGWTPLHRAAESGHAEVVRVLLAAGADINTADRGGCTPLYWAAAHGYDAVVRALLAAGATVDAADIEGCTPLYWAANNNYGLTVRLLLAAGADVSVVDRYKGTLLHRAVSGDHGVVAQLLAAYGAVPLTRASYARNISRMFFEDQQEVQEKLEWFQPLTEQASLERKQAIESTLGKVRVQSVQLPRSLRELIISLSEHLDVITWWRQVELGRLRAVSHMRLPIEALKRIVMFDSPQDIGLFRGMLE